MQYAGRGAAHLAATLLNLFPAAGHILLPPLHLALVLVPLPRLLDAGGPLSLWVSM